MGTAAAAFGVRQLQRVRAHGGAKQNMGRDDEHARQPNCHYLAPTTSTGVSSRGHDHELEREPRYGVLILILYAQDRPKSVRGSPHINSRCPFYS